MLAGCATTNVTQQTPLVSPGLARPKQIWVYDFIADPAQVPADSSISAELSEPSTPPTAEELDTGRELGALIAKDVVADIQAMGLSAVQAGPGSAPQVGDGVIRGYLVSVEGGSAVKRFVIGLGAGTAELDTVVEGYAMTPQGLTPTRIGDAELVRQQDARSGRAGRSGDCDPQSDRTDRRQRHEALWREERQEYA